MLKYAKIINETTKQCQVGLGDNIEYYKKQGMALLDIEQAYNGSWYIQGYAPTKPEPTVQEKLNELEVQYNMPRVIREGILANPNVYSQYNVLRAKELEELAEIIRKKGK